jgi:hypothetical protein
MTPSDDLPQLLLISDKSQPVAKHLANLPRCWISEPIQGEETLAGRRLSSEPAGVSLSLLVVCCFSTLMGLRTCS